MVTHRLSEDAKGVYIISATPFLDDSREVTLKILDRMLTFFDFKIRIFSG